MSSDGLTRRNVTRQRPVRKEGRAWLVSWQLDVVGFVLSTYMINHRKADVIAKNCYVIPTAMTEAARTSKMLSLICLIIQIQNQICFLTTFGAALSVLYPVKGLVADPPFTALA